MIIAISDLHLATDPMRSAINTPRLLQRISGIVRNARGAGVQRIELLLLGDIFELLRTDQWLASSTRPWDESTVSHLRVVDAIFTDIVAANQEFFDGLSQLVREHPDIDLQYVPGNHDRVINTPMGALAREHLCAVLPLKHQLSAPFEGVFLDAEHQVVARHGHEWDADNRYGPKYIAVGDVVVVELLVRLPTMVSERLNIQVDDPALDFIYDLDNVRPSAPRVLAQWLLAGLDYVRASYPGAPKALQEALQASIQAFTGLQRQRQLSTWSTPGWWTKFLSRVVPAATQHLDLLDLAGHLPWGGSGHGPYIEYARRDMRLALRNGDYRYILCGHTHIPELVPFALRIAQGPTSFAYINTGTWRRVHRMIPGPDRTGLPIFVKSEEECIVCLYNSAEQQSGHLPYEYHRVDRGG
jgi:UDP-2,3-diacylglucosamine pyrophosphatase LpxH